MKKIYQVPTLTVVRVDMTPILAGSPGYDETVTEQRNGNLSRGGSLWDDDDEDY